MKVSGYVEFIVAGELQNLAISDVGDLTDEALCTEVQLVNQSKFLAYVNMANIELHKRFPIKKQEYPLEDIIDGDTYKLPTDFLYAISAMFTEDGTEVPINSSDPSYNTAGINTKVSVVIDSPNVALIRGTDPDNKRNITLRYAASPILAKKMSTELYLPHVYTEALINYASYKAFVAVSGDGKAENNMYYLRFIESCKQINLLGLQNPDNLDNNTKLDARGFV